MSIDLRQRVEALNCPLIYKMGSQAEVHCINGYDQCKADVLALLDGAEGKSAGAVIGDAIGDLKYLRMKLRAIDAKCDIACKFIDRAAEYLDNAVQELEDTTPRGEAT